MKGYRCLLIDEMPKFRGLTYPSYAAALDRGDAALIAVGATRGDGEPLGLALGRTAGPAVNLLSMMVAASARGIGHGARLLERFGTAAGSAGAERIDTVVPLSVEGEPTILASGLDRRGWHRAGVATVTIKSEPARVAAALAARHMRPVPGWSIMPWSYRPDPWWAPIELAPSGWLPMAPDGRPWVRRASVDIVDGTNREGWIIAHDMGGGWLRVSNSFLRPTGTARRAIFDIWRSYFEMVAGQGWDIVTFATTEDHGPFFAFLQRWASHFALWWGCSAPFTLQLRTQHGHAA